jgi:hypothetical protein
MEQIRFAPKQISGRGWTVVRIIGSKRTGRTEHPCGFGDTYTLAQAQVVAQNAQRDHAHNKS